MWVLRPHSFECAVRTGGALLSAPTASHVLWVSPPLLPLQCTTEATSLTLCSSCGRRERRSVGNRRLRGGQPGYGSLPCCFASFYRWLSSQPLWPALAWVLGLNLGALRLPACRLRLVAHLHTVRTARPAWAHTVHWHCWPSCHCTGPTVRADPWPSAIPPPAGLCRAACHAQPGAGAPRCEAAERAAAAAAAAGAGAAATAAASRRRCSGSKAV